MPGDLTPKNGPPNPEPDWWPAGADEAVVRDCNCDYCAELVDALEDFEMGLSPDGQHQAITAFAGGGDD